MDKLRLRFSKTGRAIYISHLDLMRTMQRSFLRAGYQLKYSEGFNPHAQISIALPLSLGMGSYCELMDFRLETDENLDEMPARLSEKMPEGIQADVVYHAERKFAQLKWLSCEGILEYDNSDVIETAQKLNEFFSMESILVLKKTKRGENEVDIRKEIKSIEFTHCENSVKVNLTVSAQEPTINPELICEALRQHSTGLTPDFAKFVRIETFDENMEIFR